jgi:CBS domain-containing protein
MLAIDLTPPTLVTTDETTSLPEAARLMRDKGVGNVVVTRGKEDGGRPIGIVTDRDIVVHALALEVDLGALTVADLCTREPASVDARADLFQISATMNEHGVRRVLVFRDRQLAGIVSLDDVVAAVARLMNNLTAMLERQIEFEREHLVPPPGHGSA